VVIILCKKEKPGFKKASDKFQENPGLSRQTTRLPAILITKMIVSSVSDDFPDFIPLFVD
jgi:hypothetical protein